MFAPSLLAVLMLPREPMPVSVGWRGIGTTTGKVVVSWCRGGLKMSTSP